MGKKKKSKTAFYVDRDDLTKVIKKELLLGYDSIEEAISSAEITSQTEAILRMLAGDNIYLAGPAGSGKTLVVRTFLNVMKALYGKNVRIAVSATTGIAATLLNGRTLHSTLGMGITHELFVPSDMSFFKGAKKVKEISKIDVLIIDEVSMLSADVLENVDARLKYCKKNKLPFGGVQVIFSGDFLQLPPVVKGKQFSGKIFAFESKVWEELDLKYCFLDKIHRSKDTRLSYVLERIVDGTYTNDAKFRELITPRFSKYPNPNASILFTKNNDVKSFNQQSQDKNPNELKMFELKKLFGSQEDLHQLKTQNEIPEAIGLKVNDIVMVTDNIDANTPNGLIGRITYIGKFEEYDELDEDHEKKDLYGVEIETSKGRKVQIVPMVYELKTREWVDVGGEMDLQEELLASVSQIPLKLAYALTVHKSQGQTFDGVSCDLSQIFTEGLGYVALSRAQNLDSITITGLVGNAFKLNEQCKDFMEEVKYSKEHFNVITYFENLLENIENSRIRDKFIFDGVQGAKKKTNGKSQGISKEFLIDNHVRALLSETINAESKLDTSKNLLDNELLKNSFVEQEALVRERKERRELKKRIVDEFNKIEFEDFSLEELRDILERLRNGKL